MFEIEKQVFEDKTLLPSDYPNKIYEVDKKDGNNIVQFINNFFKNSSYIKYNVFYENKDYFKVIILNHE